MQRGNESHCKKTPVLQEGIYTEPTVNEGSPNETSTIKRIRRVTKREGHGLSEGYQEIGGSAAAGTTAMKAMNNFRIIRLRERIRWSEKMRRGKDHQNLVQRGTKPTDGVPTEQIRWRGKAHHPEQVSTKDGEKGRTKAKLSVEKERVGMAGHVPRAS